jgi:hypothetical protein
VVLIFNAGGYVMYVWDRNWGQGNQEKREISLEGVQAALRRPQTNREILLGEREGPLDRYFQQVLRHDPMSMELREAENKK